ncbi:MAG: YqgE/AlgH family protein [Lentisphaerae bacterium]|nr:MAG: YqgE/AlgH family protein [Lentisphaerota bacterium]
MGADAFEPFQKGSLLLASPQLMDINFVRAAVLLCEHTREGSFGLILNHKTDLTLDILIDAIDRPFPVYHGGPVQENSLHILHCRPDLDLGGDEVVTDVYWGADIEKLTMAINTNMIQEDECRIFIGYSGWDAKQLAMECEMNAWFIVPANHELVFRVPARKLWREAFRTLGESYRFLANMPDNPELN